jgi:hypothetical protein
VNPSATGVWGCIFIFKEGELDREFNVPQKIGKSRDHKGVAIYWYKKDPTPGAETSQRPPSERLLLRLTEFILPPPHPSVKELPPQGGNSYDQLGVGYGSMRGPSISLCEFLKTFGQPTTPGLGFRV